MSGEIAVAKITEKIEAKASKQIQEILKKQEEAINQIKKETEEKIKELRERILKEAKNKAEGIFQRERSKYELEYKLKLSKFRDELVETVIEKAKDEIKKQLETERYIKSLEDLIISAAITLKEPELVIYVREDDKKKLSTSFLNKIKEKIKNEYNLDVKLSVADKFINCLGGVVIETPDGKLKINNTYDAKLERQINEIRNKIASLIVQAEEG